MGSACAVKCFRCKQHICIFKAPCAEPHMFFSIFAEADQGSFGLQSCDATDIEEVNWQAQSAAVILY